MSSRHIDIYRKKRSKAWEGSSQGEREVKAKVAKGTRLERAAMMSLAPHTTVELD